MPRVDRNGKDTQEGVWYDAIPPSPKKLQANVHPSLGFIALMGGMSLAGPLAINMNTPGLAQTARDLNISAEAAQQSMAAFLFGFAAGQLIWGALTDRWGRRRPALLGLSLFFMTSVLCAVSTSGSTLFFARLAHGFAACSGLTLARAIISDRFSGREAAVVFSWQHLVMGIGPIFAPLIGSALLRIFDWRSIFWVLAILAAVMLPCVFLYLSETRSADHAAYARDESRLKAYLSILLNRPILGYVLTSGFAASTLMCWYSGASLLFEQDFHWSSSSTAIVISALGLTIVAATQINRRLLRRYDPRDIIRYALMSGVAIFVLTLVFVLIDPTKTHWVAATGIVMGVSLYGMLSANIQALALAIDRRRAGSIGALIGASNYGIGSVFAWLVSELPSLHGTSMLVLMATQFIAASLALKVMTQSAHSES